MNATILEVKVGKLNNNYDGYHITYQGDAFKGKEKDPTTRFVFANDRNHPELPSKVAALKAGDYVDMTFEQNGKYKNLVDVKVIGKEKKPSSSGSSSSAEPQYNEDTALRIQRSVAVKAAIDSFNAMAAGGWKGVKATMKPEVFGDMVLNLARQYEPYLTLSSDEAAMAAMVTEAEGMDQETYEDA